MIVSPNQALGILLDGGVVALPTETVYGLAASAFNYSALEKIFKIKQRPLFDPLIVHIGSKAQVFKVVEHWPLYCQKLADAFWPGPLTIITKKHADIGPLVTADQPYVAVRMPQNSIFVELANAVGPLAAPSANRFGKTSPTTARHVESEFSGQIPVVDGGDCAVGIESTIIKVSELPDETISVIILRPGAISETDILKCLSVYYKKIEVSYGTSKDTPGGLTNHYQPDFPLVIAQNGVRWNKALHSEISQTLKIKESSEPMFWDFSSSDPLIVARTLYKELREHSEKIKGGSYIFLTLPIAYTKPRWVAIKDRIDKACTAKIKKINGLPQIFVKNKSF
ncbi:threonylcarbamoyl-AMP synthase [bacterium]|nr:threonylcarbamoyl-AMP synthase [bacterium]